MFTCLAPGAIGIRGLALPAAIALARESGFAGLAFDIKEAAESAAAQGAPALRALFADAGIAPGYWGLPVAWRDDAERWQADLKALPALASVARELGCDRATTVMQPGSNERAYDENFAWHVERLRPVATALRDAGCRLGIEYIGPRTFRQKFRHEFIYDLKGLLDLAAAIGTGNVGVLLDAWHLYTSGGTAADLTRLTARDVVAVHVNDAPAGIARDDQIDTVRALPLETGVMDLAGFMGQLRAIGYDGPVTPEPFSQRLNDLAVHDPLGAAREAERTTAALWSLGG
ncbi:MAG: sugar phosphate isomerase/epimerase family protein [Thermomicrobiales bacterium]